MSNQIVKHSRSVYGLLDLFGDFGGFMEVLLLTASLFISPIASHSFLIKAIQKLFVVRSRKKGVFK